MCSFLVKRSAREYNHSTKLKALGATKSQFASIKGALYRLTRKRLTPDINTEVLACLESTWSLERKPKPTATFDDFKDIVMNGVWGPHKQWRCASERLMISIFLNLMVYMACRPSELAKGVHDNDALKWKDVEFALSLQNGRQSQEDGDDGEVSSNAPLRLTCDVTLRNIKGGKIDKSKHRTQPLYSDKDLPPGLDATAMLACWAEMDGVLDNNVSIASAIESADRNYFKDRSHLPIKIRNDCREKFVFRNLARNQDDSSMWSVSDQPMTSNTISALCKKAARLAGFRDFTIYALRRSVGNALQRAKIDENSRNASMGHGYNSSCFWRYYWSRRNHIDIQGLFALGREQHAVIIEHGLRHFRPQVLTPLQIRELDEHVTVVEMRRRYQEVRICLCLIGVIEGYTDHSDLQQKDTLDRLTEAATDEVRGALQVAVKKAYGRWANCRTFHRIEMLDREAVKSLDAQHASALHGGPNAAKEAIVVDLQEDDDTDDPQENCRDVEAALQRADQLTHQREGSASSVNARQPIKPKESLLSSRLADGLNALSTNTTLDTYHGQVDVNRLSKPANKQVNEAGEAIKLADYFSIYQSDAGTVNGNIETMRTAESCPTCCEPFTTCARNTNGGPPTAISAENHITKCASTTLNEQYKEACREALHGQPCPHEECRPKNTRFEGTIQEIEEHIERHRAKTCGYIKCGYQNDDGQVCTWSAPEDETMEGTDTSKFAYHAEVCHGIPDLTCEGTSLCRGHRCWLFGANQIETHYSEHLDVLASGEQDGNFDWVLKSCAFCALDDQISTAARCKVYPVKTEVTVHSLQHIYDNRDPKPLCPCCREAMDARDLPEHLLQEHARSLAHHGFASIGRDFTRLWPPQSHKLGKRTAWDAWIKTLDEADTMTPTISAGNTQDAPFRGAIDINDADAETIEAAAEEAEQEARERSSASTMVAPRRKSNTGKAVEEQDPVASNSRNSFIPAAIQESYNYTKGKSTSNKLRTRYQCAFCIVEATASGHPAGTSKAAIAEAEANTYRKYEPFGFAQHVCTRHLFANRDQKPICPSCGEEVEAKGFVTHLEGHDWCLSGNSTKVGDNLQKLAGVSIKSPNKTIYIAWLKAGCPIGRKQFKPKTVPRIRPLASRKAQHRTKKSEENIEISDEDDTVEYASGSGSTATPSNTSDTRRSSRQQSIGTAIPTTPAPETPLNALTSRRPIRQESVYSLFRGSQTPELDGCSTTTLTPSPHSSPLAKAASMSRIVPYSDSSDVVPSPPQSPRLPTFESLLGRQQSQRVSTSKGQDSALVQTRPALQPDTRHNTLSSTTFSADLDRPISDVVPRPFKRSRMRLTSDE